MKNVELNDEQLEFIKYLDEKLDWISQSEEPRQALWAFFDNDEEWAEKRDKYMSVDNGEIMHSEEFMKLSIKHAHWMI